MKEYFRWCWHYLCLIFFCPSRLLRMREDARDLVKAYEKFYLKLLPWIGAGLVFGHIAVGYILAGSGLTFHWAASWIGVFAGWIFVPIAVGLGSVFGVKVSAGLQDSYVKAFARLFGAFFAITFGLIFSVTSGLLGFIAGGTLCGLFLGVWLPHLGSRLSVRGGIWFGLMPLLFFYFLIILPSTLVISTIIACLLTYFRFITYPFDLALTIATYSMARRHLVRQAWSFCPITWNELIWLPLPFLKDVLIMMVREDREEGFRQIAFVVAERKLQRRVARDAMVEVAVDDLQADSVETLPIIAEQLNWVNDAFVDLPNELMIALTRFSRAAQHVAQYQTLTSTYRKGEALARAKTEVERLQHVLVVAHGRYTSRLLQVANKWRDLLEDENNRAIALATVVQEIPNVFVYGPPVAETENNVFTGRRDIVRQIEAGMLGARQPPTLLLHGSRRMGKTSILNQLSRLLGPDFAPTTIDCQNPAITASPSTLLRYISRALSTGLGRRHTRIEALTSEALDREPYGAFDDWMEKLEKTMPQGLRVLVCLDEYERLQATLEAGWGGAFLDALRHLLQHRRRVVLMFAGAHTFQELGPAWTDRFVSARRVRVSFLAREEVLPLLTKPIPEFDMTYAPEALNTIIAATNCQPFLTQATAFELVQLLNEQERKEATPNDVEMAIARALVSGGEYFANVWNDAGQEGQAILGAIVHGKRPPSFSTAHKWLYDHDVLNRQDEFAIEMMRCWVKMKCS